MDSDEWLEANGCMKAVANVAATTVTSEHTHDDKEASDCSAVYEPHTFRPGSINSQRRLKLLPAYPLANNDPDRSVLLLLPNVALPNRDQLESKSFCGGHGISPFEFVQHRYVDSIDSFMIDLYRDLFIDTGRQWKIPHSLIDYNLSRLRACMHLYTQQTNAPALSSFNEWPMALEFFLQIDGRQTLVLFDSEHLLIFFSLSICVQSTFSS